MAFNLYTHMREHGENREAIKGLKAKVAMLEANTTAMEATKNKVLGGWRALLLVGTAAGIIGGIVARYLFH